MAVGIYGTVRPSDTSLDDIDVFYNFTPNRGVENNEIFRLEPSDVLTPVLLPDGDDNELQGGDNLLEGLYNLRLPATTFNNIGVYTVYIKPKSFLSVIADCSVLSALPNVKGLVLDRNELPENLRSNNALQGYSIEYFDDNNQKIRNTVRHVVSSNICSPTNENNGDTNQSSTRYRFDDGGSLMFLQVSPSSAPNVKPNQFPFIGNTGGVIKISNTYFSPVVIEVDMVENTVESLANILIGEQIKDVDNGILSYYDKDRNIIKQYDLFKIKSDVGQVSTYEVKMKRDNIDETQDFDDIISDI